MVKFIHNEQGNKETSEWVNWVPKELASHCEAGWRIRGHMHLPQIILLLLSERKYIILPPSPEELKFPLVPHGGSLFITGHSLGWPLPEMSAPDMMPQIHLPNHQKGGSKRLVWIMRTSHFPYLVFVIKTCLLKHTFPLLSTWKIYGYCIAFHTSALNSANTQAIFLVITDDFSSNLKLSSLALSLWQCLYHLFMQANNDPELCEPLLRGDCFNHLFLFSILEMCLKKKTCKFPPTDYSYHSFGKNKTAAKDVKLNDNRDIKCT